MWTEQGRKGSRRPARHAAHTTARTVGLSSPWRLREEGTPEGKGRNTIDSTQAAACFINVLYSPLPGTLVPSVAHKRLLNADHMPGTPLGTRDLAAETRDGPCVHETYILMGEASSCKKGEVSGGGRCYEEE